MRRARVEGTIAFLIYVAVSVAFFGIPILRDPSHSYIGISNDPATFIWFLTWWPYATLHGLNPFFPDVVWAPAAVNLAWANAIPGVSLLVSPITLAAGAVVAYNFVCLLALPLSAWTAYLLCRHITGTFGAALFGGYFFGFSSYELGQLLGGHVNLILTFIVPLCALLVLMRLGDAISPRAFVLLLALTLVFQFLFSLEVFATMSAIGALSIVIAFITGPPKSREGLMSISPTIGSAYALAALALSPDLYYAFAHGVPRFSFAPESYASHVNNFLLPTGLTRLRPHWLYDIGGRYGEGSIVEDGAYLGLPLMAVIVLFGVSSWHKPAARIVLLSLASVCLLSLGPELRLGYANVPLPWKLVLRLPLIHLALPARLIVYASLCVAVIVAMWAQAAGRGGWWKWSLLSLSVLTLAPNLLLPGWRSIEDTPAFFTSGHYKRYLSTGEIALIIAPGRGGRAMLWQAQTGMYFRMTYGYVIPYDLPEEFQRWPIIQTFYGRGLVPDYERQLRDYLLAHDVKTVIVVKKTPGPWNQLFSTLRVPPLDIDDVILYKL